VSEYHAVYESDISYSFTPDDFPVHPGRAHSISDLGGFCLLKRIDPFLRQAQRQVLDQEKLQISFRSLSLPWHLSVIAVAISVDSISRGKP
jgi:hypothetical protein